MNIFNSLGSNYDWPFVWQSVFGFGQKDQTKLKQLLHDDYGGSVTFTYKGREALELALRQSGLPAGSSVAINGFSCYVVYQAVQNAGYQPIFIDVADKSLDYGIQELQDAHQAHPDLKAIIVQNTLGLPVDIQALENYCHEHQLMIIEDVAHSQGAMYADKRLVGTVGQLAMLTFSQDKPIDVVAGGVLINRLPSPISAPVLPNVSIGQQLKNRFYPFWSSFIRQTYPLGFGRFVHLGLKKTHLLATPMSDNSHGLYVMTPLAVKLLEKRWPDRAEIAAHHQHIGNIYQQELDPSCQFSTRGTPLFLRFPILVSDRAALVQLLKKQHLYIGDTWYDAPVAPKRYMERTNYQTGQCPNAENLSVHIVNLPTHRGVSENDAKEIATKVNSWLKSQ